MHVLVARCCMMDGARYNCEVSPSKSSLVPLFFATLPSLCISMMPVKLSLSFLCYRKASGKAPVIHPGDEPPFLSRRRGGGVELAFTRQQEYTAVV